MKNYVTKNNTYTINENNEISGGIFGNEVKKISKILVAEKNCPLILELEDGRYVTTSVVQEIKIA
ncbi:MAG: hypothetical protein K0R54_273 [Clostridiaceae bacterium]|jgi:hypothetical protein|nr:hypothetical protein [Clostridiaceae bacterium]